MGRFNNQLHFDLELPNGATDVQVKLQIYGTVATSQLILDTIWFSGPKEIAQHPSSIVLGGELVGVLRAMQVVPPGADRLTLSARPWREVDGVLTVGEGEVVWCAK